MSRKVLIVDDSPTERFFLTELLVRNGWHVLTAEDGDQALGKARVERPAAVHARWLDEHGVAHDERIEGMLATCIQHEMDHLEGVLFIDHLSRLKRDRAVAKVKKNARLAA